MEFRLIQNQSAWTSFQTHTQERQQQQANRNEPRHEANNRFARKSTTSYTDYRNEYRSEWYRNSVTTDQRNQMPEQEFHGGMHGSSSDHLSFGYTNYREESYRNDSPVNQRSWMPEQEFHDGRYESSSDYSSPDYTDYREEQYQNAVPDNQNNVNNRKRYLPQNERQEYSAEFVKRRCLETARPLTNWGDLRNLYKARQLPTLQQLADLFHKTQNKKKDIANDLLYWIAGHFVDIANNVPAHEKTVKNYSARIGKILCGCQQISTISIKNAGTGINYFLNEVARFTNILFEEGITLNDQNIGHAIYGLNNMTISEGTEALLITMERHIRVHQQFSGVALCRALYGIQKMGSSPATEALFLACAVHFKNGHSGQLPTKAIAMALYGLQNLMASPGAKALLKEIRHCIENMDCNQFSTQNIAIACHGMRNLEPDLSTDIILRKFIKSIQQMPDDQFSAQQIGMILSVLQNIPHSELTESLLNSMMPHINNCPQFGIHAICNALTGLRGLTSKYVSDIFQVLTKKIATGRSFQDGDEKRINFHLADILNSVNTHFSSGGQQVRENVVQFAAALLGEYYSDIASMDELRGSTTLDDIIFELVSPSVIRGNKCDLHLCSHALAAMLTRYSLEQFLEKQLKNNSEELTIVFGRSTHFLHNAGRMKTVVEEAVNTSLSTSKQRVATRWYDGEVLVYGLRKLNFAKQGQ